MRQAQDDLAAPLLRPSSFERQKRHHLDGLTTSEHLSGLMSLRSERSGSDDSYVQTSNFLSKLQNFNDHKLDHSSAIYQSPNISYPVKILIPVMIVLNIGMFLLSNSSVGAGVVLKAKIFDLETEQISLFNFSLVNTVTDMYNAKAYFLSGLVLLWSGAWPYFKLAVMFFCWFAHPSVLGSGTRGKMLIVMDMLGKWCMLDSFLMVMMSVAFHFDLILHSSDVFALNVTVLNGFGMFSFVAGAIMTLVLSHALLAYHKNANNLQIREDTIVTEAGYIPRTFCCTCPEGSWFNVGSLSPNEMADQKVSLFKFIAGERVKFRNQRLGRQCRILALHMCIGTALVVTLFMIFFGARTEAFTFEFDGLAGEMIRMVKPELKKASYSLLSIAESTTSRINDDLTTDNSSLYQLSQSDYYGIYFMKFIYLVFAYWMPLCLVVFLFALWFIPMNLRDQKIMYYVLEIISSWSALDVFIVCIIAANQEISQFAIFLLQDECKYIEEVTQETCFIIKTEFLPGMYILVAAGICLVVTTSVVISYAEDNINTRESLALLEIEEQERSKL